MYFVNMKKKLMAVTQSNYSIISFFLLVVATVTPLVSNVSTFFIMAFFIDHKIAIDLQLRYSFSQKLKIGLMKMQIHCTVNQIHGTVLIEAHGTEEGLTPRNVLHICTVLHIFL